MMTNSSVPVIAMMPSNSGKSRVWKSLLTKVPWQPDPQRIPANKLMSLIGEYSKVEVRSAIRATGGRWNPRQKVWKLAYKEVVALGLTDHIVQEERERQTDRATYV